MRKAGERIQAPSRIIRRGARRRKRRTPCALFMQGTAIAHRFRVGRAAGTP